jgi:UDP:flavonoid glycosyltransferase YjiC (YdhE family)
MIAFDYAACSKLFPEAAAIVHQGGIGTTGQALQAGKPTLVVPSAHDQPDNARRLARLGISQTLPLKRCSVRGMVRALRALTENPSYRQRAATIGQKVRSGDGVEAACVAIEALLGTTLNDGRFKVGRSWLGTIHRLFFYQKKSGRFGSKLNPATGGAPPVGN